MASLFPRTVTVSGGAPGGGDTTRDIVEELDERVHEGCEGGVGLGHRMELAVRSRLAEAAVGGAGDSGQGQSRDQSHADAGADQGLGDVVGLSIQPERAAGVRVGQE
jgi:hypothetical protein